VSPSPSTTARNAGTDHGSGLQSVIRHQDLAFNHKLRHNVKILTPMQPIERISLSRVSPEQAGRIHEGGQECKNDTTSRRPMRRHTPIVRAKAGSQDELSGTRGGGDRHGLMAAAMATQADGRAEREASVLMLSEFPNRRTDHLGETKRMTRGACGAGARVGSHTACGPERYQPTERLLTDARPGICWI